MIALITGKIVDKQPGQALLMTAGGVGYRVFISLNTYYELPAVGQEVSLFTHTAVREDAIHLFGFAHEQEKQLFNKLIAVSGVGAKLALTLLGGIAPLELWQALRARDLERLTKIPGIGKKTAARLLVELEGKLPPAGSSAELAAEDQLQADAVSALINFGYPEASAQKALKAVNASENPPGDLPELLKACLRFLGNIK
jgi:Holliday junction DNA helicase RuvA